MDYEGTPVNQTPPASPRKAQAESIAALAGVDPDTGGPVPAKRTFDTGATRDTEQGKLDFEGFFSPLVMVRYAEYLNSHRTMKDGSTRDSDNWQKGIPLNVYMKSAYRHFVDVWMVHRKWIPDTGTFMEDAMCAVMFNVAGYLHERLKKKILNARADNADPAFRKEREGV